MTGNMVDEVRIGEGTRRDARGRVDTNGLNAEIGALRAVKEELVARKNKNVTRIQQINGELVATLPRQRFDKLTRERTQIATDNAEIDQRLRDINLRLKPLQHDLFNAEHGSTADGTG